MTRKVNKFINVVIITILMFTLSTIKVSADEKYHNYSSANNYVCGENDEVKIPRMIPVAISKVYLIIEIAVPIVLVIMGSIDLVKGITAQKEDEIKKGQQIFIKRMIAGICIFFTFAIVKVIISLAASGTSSSIIKCTECIIKRSANCKEKSGL